MALNRVEFMNTYIDNVSKKEVIQYVEQCIKERKVTQITTPNVDIIVKIEKDEYFKEICDNSDLLLVDGTPLMWIAKWYKKPFKEKICGSDLMPELCSVAAKKGYRVFLLGAALGVADIAAQKLKDANPGLQIAGTYSPPIGFEKDQQEIDHINQVLLESKADMLFVGMGVPKQERFIYENKEIYQIPTSFSIGGTIDFIAGKQKRAPKWINKIGMEWLYRFFCSPKRMFKRYFVDDMKIFKLARKYRPRKRK